MTEITDHKGNITIDDLLQVRGYDGGASFVLVRLSDNMRVRHFGDARTALAHAQAMIADGRVK
jgi:hypothetical protein